MSAYSMISDRDLELARRTGFAFGTVKRACRQIAMSSAEVAFELRKVIGGLEYIMEAHGIDLLDCDIANIKLSVDTIEEIRETALTASSIEMPSLDDVPTAIDAEMP